MNTLQSMHQAHKNRLVRLGAVPVKTISFHEFERQKEALHELQMKSDRQQGIISELNSTVAKQRTLIRKFADESEAPTPRVADVVAVIAEHFNFTKLIIIGGQRTAKIASARQVGYYICREFGFPWHSIGRGFGKDHTSALHGSRQIAERLSIENDTKLELEIEEIKTKIDRYVARRIESTKAALS